LKCSAAKEILDDLERAIDNLDIQTDNSLSQRAAKQCVVPQSSNVHDPEILKGKVSIRAPDVIKGPKNKRA
jgi:hypothetical protein